MQCWPRCQFSHPVEAGYAARRRGWSLRRPDLEMELISRYDVYILDFSVPRVDVAGWQLSSSFPCNHLVDLKHALVPSTAW